jgi:hypothetical protein
VHIAEKNEGEYHVLLCQINNLNVEVFYNEEHNFIRKFQAFTKMELLDIYINEIPLEDFL